MKKLIIIFFITILFGCNTLQVRTSSTTFHGNDHIQRGEISVMPIDKNQENSLEFKHVSEYLLAKLYEVKYLPSSSNEKSQYETYITYGIDNGNTSTTSVPLFGRTGGGTSYTYGTVSTGNGLATVTGTTTTMPTYGVVGSKTVNETVYKRVVNIDIYRKNPNKTAIKVYEIKAISSGSCGNINSVLFIIIDAVFKNFPGVNGIPKTVEIPLDKEC
jgi:hypothetical protein